MRAALGCTKTPNRPGIRFLMTAWPTSGEGVLPSASYCGHTMITPTATWLPWSVGAIGQAFWFVSGSTVPLSELLSGMLNMS